MSKMGDAYRIVKRLSDKLTKGEQADLMLDILSLDDFFALSDLDDYKSVLSYCDVSIDEYYEYQQTKSVMDTDDFFIVEYEKKNNDV